MAMNPQLLSYHDMTLDPSGKIMSDEAKSKLRKQYGYCLTCPNVPVLLFDIQKNRLNPLWSNKVPRTVEGLCHNGRCLQCNPRLASRYGTSGAGTSSSTSLDLGGGSNHSRDSQQENRSLTSATVVSAGGTSRVSRDGSAMTLGSSRSSHHHQHGRSSMSTSSSSSGGSTTAAPSAVTVRSGHRTRPRRSGTRPQQPLGSFIDKNRDTQNRSGSSDDASIASANSYHTSMTSMSMPMVPAGHHRLTTVNASSPREAGFPASHEDASESRKSLFENSSNTVDLPRRSAYREHGRKPPRRSDSADSLPVVSQSEHVRYQSGGQHGDLFHSLGALDSPSLHPASSVDTSSYYKDPSATVREPLTPVAVTPNSSHSTDITMSMSSHSTQATSVAPDRVEREPFHESGNGRTNGRRDSATTCTSSYGLDDGSTDGMVVEEDDDEHQQHQQHGAHAAHDDGGVKAIDELKVLVQALSGDENLGILTEILISSMNLHKSCEPLQAYVLQVMATAFDNSVTESEVLMSKILGAMQNFPSSLSVQTAGCTVLHSLSKQASNGELIVRSGACRALSVALSRHIGDESLICVSVASLRMLSVQREAQEWLAENEVAGAVAQAMQFHATVAQVQRDGCALLSNIAVKAEERTVAAVGDDVVEAVVGALKDHGSDPTVVASACFALKNFSYEETNMKSLAKIPEAVDLLVRATSAGGLDDAYAVLEKLQVTMAEEESLRDQTMNGVASLGSVVDIVELMKHNCRSPKSVLSCMKALTALIKAKPSEHEVLQNDGEVLAYLLQCTELYTTDLQIQQEARRLMDSLLSSGGDEEVDISVHSTTPRSNQGPLYVNAESQE